MFKKKSIAALLLAATLFAFVFPGCSGSGDKSSSGDSTSVQAPPAAAPADSGSSSTIDTTKLDSASTRPIKSPTK